MNRFVKTFVAFLITVVSITANAVDFGISTTERSVTSAQNSSSSGFQRLIIHRKDFDGPIDVDVEVSPAGAGVDAHVDDNSLLRGGNQRRSEVDITTDVEKYAENGSYQVTVTATGTVNGEKRTRVATFTLVVKRKDTFSIAVIPEHVTLPQGSVATTNVEIGEFGKFSDRVYLEIHSERGKTLDGFSFDFSGANAGYKGAANRSDFFTASQHWIVSPNDSNNSTSQLTITTYPDTVPGEYIFYVHGQRDSKKTVDRQVSGGGTAPTKVDSISTRRAKLKVTVTADPAFIGLIEPVEFEVYPGVTEMVTPPSSEFYLNQIYVTAPRSLNTIKLKANLETKAPGISVAMDRSRYNPEKASYLFVVVTDDAKPGTYYATITATSRGSNNKTLTKTTLVKIIVPEKKSSNPSLTGGPAEKKPKTEISTGSGGITSASPTDGSGSSDTGAKTGLTTIGGGSPIKVDCTGASCPSEPVTGTCSGDTCPGSFTVNCGDGLCPDEVQLDCDISPCPETVKIDCVDLGCFAEKIIFGFDPVATNTETKTGGGTTGATPTGGTGTSTGTSGTTTDTESSSEPLSCPVDAVSSSLSEVSTICPPPECKSQVDAVNQTIRVIKDLDRQINIQIAEYNKLCMDDGDDPRDVAPPDDCNDGKKISLGMAYTGEGNTSVSVRERIRFGVGNSADTETYSDFNDMITTIGSKLREPIDKKGVCRDCVKDLFLLQHGGLGNKLAGTYQFGELIIVDNDVDKKTGKLKTRPKRIRMKTLKNLARLRDYLCEDGRIVFVQCNIGRGESGSVTGQGLSNFFGVNVMSPTISAEAGSCPSSADVTAGDWKEFEPKGEPQDLDEDRKTEQEKTREYWLGARQRNIEALKAQQKRNIELLARQRADLARCEENCRGTSDDPFSAVTSLPIKPEFDTGGAPGSTQAVITTNCTKCQQFADAVNRDAALLKKLKNYLKQARDGVRERETQLQNETDSTLINKIKAKISELNLYIETNEPNVAKLEKGIKALKGALSDCEKQCIDILILDVISLLGNNPFDRRDPISEETGSGSQSGGNISVIFCAGCGPGVFVPVAGLIVAAPDACPAVHYHGGPAKACDGNTYPDPAPGVCGYGEVPNTTSIPSSSCNQ